MSATPTDLVDFIHQIDHVGLPKDVRHQMRRCLLDLVGVAAAGTATPLSQILRDHTHRHTSGGADAPRLLFDGRRVSAAHAALANAGTIDSMDAHDGHRLAKGHAGAAVLPAALAFLDAPETSGGPDGPSTHDLVAAVAVGYEVALRAALVLHRTATDYHSSGAWNSIGAAAIGARLLGLDRSATAHALGIAEYSAPRGPMMRGVEHPTMVKDGSAWGAQAGVTAAFLAADGFTGSPAELLTGPEWEDLGTRWLTLEQYFKPYPVCRWSHPAVQAILSMSVDAAITAKDVQRIEVTTFEAATRLGTRHPHTTEEAQYSLPYAVAAALMHGDLTPATVLDPLAAPDTQSVADRIVVIESETMTREFPATRRADVHVELRDGRHLRSGPVAADGDPEAPLDDDRLLAKFRQYIAHRTGPGRINRVHADGHGRDQHRPPPATPHRPVLTARAWGQVLRSVVKQRGASRGSRVAAGAIDPLEAGHSAAWRHVDAAWAGPLRLSSTPRLLDGIETADSGAVSVHRWLYQPKECALVLFADPTRPGARRDRLRWRLSRRPERRAARLARQHRAATGVTLSAWGRTGMAGRSRPI